MHNILYNRITLDYMFAADLPSADLEPTAWLIVATIGCLLLASIFLMEFGDFYSLRSTSTSSGCDGKSAGNPPGAKHPPAVVDSSSSSCRGGTTTGDKYVTEDDRNSYCKSKNNSHSHSNSSNSNSSNSNSNSSNSNSSNSNSTCKSDSNGDSTVIDDSGGRALSVPTSVQVKNKMMMMVSPPLPDPDQTLTLDSAPIDMDMDPMASRIQALNEEQKAAFDCLSARYLPESRLDKDAQVVEGLPIDRACLLRYLRARKFNKDAAIKMLDDTIAWRKEFQVSKIHNEWKSTIEEECRTGKMFVRGFDKEGHVLLYMRPKNENTKDHDGNLRHLVYHLEKACACMRARTEAGGGGTGTGAIEKLSLLIDYEDFSLLNAPPFKTSMGVLSILQNHYPERLFRGFIIRPPWIFNAFWTAIYPFIDPVTKTKVVMLDGGASRHEIRRTLEEHIDPDVLEDSLGGNDSRPFDPLLYLKEDYFSLDYHSILAKESL